MGAITEEEAAERGLYFDCDTTVTLDEDGRHVYTSATTGVQWGLTHELPDPPPMLPWSWGEPPSVVWP